jgi:hypothetical protein
MPLVAISRSTGGTPSLKTPVFSSFNPTLFDVRKRTVAAGPHRKRFTELSRLYVCALEV